MQTYGQNKFAIDGCVSASLVVAALTEVRRRNQEQFGFADLAALRPIHMGGSREAVDPEVAPLLPLVDANFEVEPISVNAFRVHLVNQGGAGGVSNHDVAVISQSELAQLFEAQYLLRLRHAEVSSECLEIGIIQKSVQSNQTACLDPSVPLQQQIVHQSRLG